ncbi:c-type cytochrome [Sphingomonas sp. ERG5]|uniref:c-type cytochrome n=1 Tax=Sphingomonas sp. ERG5 TaxID=1381597 RepID=UPI001364C592|nr:cytochrome c [Sphingomonas sp. ERG5]
MIAILGSALVLAAATGANAGGQTAPAASTPSRAVSVPVDPAAILAGRKAAFLLSAANFGGMKAVIDSGGDVTKQAFAARSLANWAKALPGMFPPGSNVAPTEALPNVWTDRAGFDAKAAAYAEAAGKLAALAKAGDKPGFAAQWGEVGKTCGGCHDTYRKDDKKG